MKKTLIILFILLSNISMNAQNDDFHIPDSLILALETNTQRDLTRVEILTNIIEHCISSREFEQAKPYIDELNKLLELKPKTLDELKDANILSSIKIKTHGQQII